MQVYDVPARADDTGHDVGDCALTFLAVDDEIPPLRNDALDTADLSYGAVLYWITQRRHDAPDTIHAGDEILRRSLGDDLPPMQKRCSVTQGLDLVDLVAREQDRHTRGGEVSDPALVGELRGVVEPERRLVQKQHLRPVRQCLDEREFLAHAVRIRLYPVIRILSQVEIIEELRECALGFGFLHPVGAGEEVRVRPAREVVVVRRTVDHKTHAGADLPFLSQTLHPAHTETAGVGSYGC